MSDKSKTAEAILKKQKIQFLRRASEQFDRDMKELKQIADKYGIQVLAMATSGPPEVAKPAPTEKTAATTAEIVKAAADFLRRRGSRAQSGEIAKALIAQGLNIGENSGKKVSSYLTRTKKLFDNKPEFGGYGLAAWNGGRNAVSRD